MVDKIIINTFGSDKRKAIVHRSKKIPLAKPRHSVLHYSSKIGTKKKEYMYIFIILRHNVI